MKKLTLKYGINTGTAITLVLGIIIFVEMISYRHHKRIDLTISKRYSLSDQSIKVLKSLKKDVKITGFFNETQEGQERSFRDLLDQYSYRSSKFTYEFIDPDKNPQKAKRYKITEYGTVVIESGDKDEKIMETGEEKLTNALLKVSRETKKVVYFVKGHGEKNIIDINEQGYSFANKAIEDSNYEVKELILATTETIPEDANLLIIPGPQKPILFTELETIKKYIYKGGKIFIMVDPNTSSELVGFLQNFGISLKYDIVVDKISRIFGVDPSMPVITQYGLHAIVKDFSTATFFPLTRSVDLTVNPIDGIRVTSLLTTSANSWAETDMERFKIGDAAFDEGKDKKGPISIGIVASLGSKKKAKETFRHAFDPKPLTTETDKEGRIVVIGDSDFATNSRINILGNNDFFLNIINWLLEEEDLISIRPKESKGKPFTLTKNQQRMIFWIPLVIMPGLFILSGIVVYRKRKNMK